MKSQFLFACAVALLLPEVVLSAESEKVLPPPADRPVDFIKDVQPIFEASCLNCHGRGRAKGGFAMDTRETFLAGGDSGPAVAIGRSHESLLIDLVAGVDPDNIMPQKGKPLTAQQVGLLRAWIDQGVQWEGSVSFARHEPVNLKRDPSKLQLTKEGRNHPVDQLLEPYYRTNKFTPTELIDDRLFARRAYLDVIGLLPTAEEMQAFLDDKNADKRSALVKRLLADDQRYAEHWLSFWNDLLRNDYRGTGYIDGGRQQITKWLFSALKTNMSYDKFVAQLINPVPESAGFVKGIVWRGVVNSSQTPEMQAAQNISQVFMGVNLKCASCHDSFINEWRLSDAYGLAAVYHDGPLEMFQCDKPTGQMAGPGFIYQALGEIDPKAPKQARMQRLAEIITGPEDGRLPRTIVNRLWARFFGRGLVEPLDDMEQRAWHPDLLDWLAEDLVVGNYNLKKTMERMLTSQAYQLPAVNLGEDAHVAYVFRGPGVRRLSAEQFRDAAGQLTGVWHQKADFPAASKNIRASLVAADPLATALGRPNREQVVTSRASSATTLQALELTNGSTLAEIMSQGAQSLATQAKSPDELVSSIYWNAFGRAPTPEEQDIAAELLNGTVAKEGVEDLLWAVTMLPEFQLIY